MVLSGSTYYAFTTGTALGNHLQALVDTSGSPTVGMAILHRPDYGSSALPAVPAWEQADTQTSPGVLLLGREVAPLLRRRPGRPRRRYRVGLPVGGHGRHPHPGDPVFTDHSTQPLLCQTGLGGAIDPSPFVDPVTGHAYLVWKSNDGGSAQPAVPVVPAAERRRPVAGGITPAAAGPGHDGLSLRDHHRESRHGRTPTAPTSSCSRPGIWNSTSYSETYATCAGPTGPCVQFQQSPILSSYGSAAGPGGGSLFQDASGNWMIGYAAWQPGLHRLLVRRGPAHVRGAGHAAAPGLAAPVTGHGVDPDGRRLLAGRLPEGRSPATARR